MRESGVTTWHYKTPTIQEFNISKQYLFCNYIYKQNISDEKWTELLRNAQSSNKFYQLFT